MNSLFQLQIPKRNSRCFKGGEPLIPGMEYYSLLLEEKENQKVIRQDFCSVCWHDANIKGNVSNQSYWQSRIEHKLNEPQSQSKVAKALSLLRKMLTEPNNEPELFVMALFLARARQLVLRREFEENGCQYYLYEVARLDEFVTIKKIELSLLETATIQHSLSQKLNNDGT